MRRRTVGWLGIMLGGCLVAGLTFLTGYPVVPSSPIMPARPTGQPNAELRLIIGTIRPACYTDEPTEKIYQLLIENEDLKNLEAELEKQAAAQAGQE